MPPGNCKYPTIYFQGQPLPEYAATLDVATTNDIIDEPEADWAVWWWRFVICVGAPRQERSETIINMVSILRPKLNERPLDFLRVIDEVLFGKPQKIFSDWLETLDTVARLAATSPVCEWYGVENEPE
jgi:hypothetical protein